MQQFNILKYLQDIFADDKFLIDEEKNQYLEHLSHLWKSKKS